MLSARSKALLLLIGILALTIASAIPAAAQKGVWWWGSTKRYGVTLINLTDYTLKLVPSQTSVNTDYDCYPTPFQSPLSVNVKPYSSAVWQSDQSPVTILNYNGKMTFLPNGMDAKWAFTLNFRHQDASGAHLGKGTWVYLMPGDTANSADQWINNWVSGFTFGGYQMYLGYPATLNDGEPHNYMNLQGTDPTGIAVALYTSANTSTHVTMVVQQIDKTGLYNRTWKLNFADNSDDSMPH